MIKMLTPALLALALTACATGAPQNAPTHRWASASVASEAQYQMDHARCETESAVSKSNQAYEGKSAQFEAYKTCMVDRGYELTAYRDNKHLTH
jgi:outer membrane PBP1 activator LpoA protein